MSYEHDEDISGSTVTLTYTGGAGDITTKQNTIENAMAGTGEVTIREKTYITKADIKKATSGIQKLTFVYTKDENVTDEVGITVTDPIETVTIKTFPKQEYDDTLPDGSPISLAGGKLEAVTKSGQTIPNLIDMDTGNVVLDKTKASIANCDPATVKDKIVGGVKVGEFGLQTVTGTYTDPNTNKQYPISYQITVNDTVLSISIKNGIDSTVKNKYGTLKSGLNLNGAKIEVHTSSGGSFDVDIAPGMLTGTYNPNTISTQNVQVTYAGKTTQAGAGLDITLSNYITGITAKAPTPFETAYGSTPDYSKVKFVINYADGSKSADKSITPSEEITGYTLRPVSSKFNSSHKYNQTVTLKYNLPENVGLDVLPARATFTATTVDTVKGITVLQTPNKKTYNYGESFTEQGGSIVPTYESGAIGSNTDAIPMSNNNVTITDGSTQFPMLKPDKTKFTNGKATVTLSVTYNDPTSGKTSNTTFTVTVNDVLQSLTVTNPKNDFIWGEGIGLGSGTIEANWQSGAETTVSADDVSFYEAGTNTAVNMRPLENLFDTTTNTMQKNVELSYTLNGVTVKSNSYPITINNPIESIKVDPANMPKSSFSVNGDTTGIGGKIIVLRKATQSDADGVRVNIQDDWVKGITVSTETTGTGRDATIEYTPVAGGTTYRTTYKYTVANTVNGIEFAEMPVLKLKYGERFAASRKNQSKNSSRPYGREQ